MKQSYLIIIIFALFSCSQETNKKVEEAKHEPENALQAKSEPLQTMAAKNKIISRQGFQVEYPKDWYIDTTDSDFDIDSNFSIDSPSDGSFTNFMIFNTKIDDKEQLDAQIKEHLKTTMKKGTVSYFDKWGEYQGKGATINGKLLGVYKGELKIFAHSTDSGSVLIVSQMLDGDKAKDEEGIKTIETSFRIK